MTSNYFGICFSGRWLTYFQDAFYSKLSILFHVWIQYRYCFREEATAVVRLGGVLSNKGWKMTVLLERMSTWCAWKSAIFCQSLHHPNYRLVDVDRLGCQSLHLFLMLLHIVLMDVDCLGVYHKSDRYTLEGGRPIVERLLLVRWGGWVACSNQWIKPSTFKGLRQRPLDKRCNRRQHAHFFWTLLSLKELRAPILIDYCWTH